MNKVLPQGWQWHGWVERSGGTYCTPMSEQQLSSCSYVPAHPPFFFTALLCRSNSAPLPLLVMESSFSASSILIISATIAVTTIVFFIIYRVILTKCRTQTLQDDNDSDSFIALSPATWNMTHGLDGSAILGIPTFRFRSAESGPGSGGCSVCLNDFHDQDLLRFLPNCTHSFHLDCIDIWFRSNLNCPLCRTTISTVPARNPNNGEILAPSSSPRDTETFSGSFFGGDEDFVVIELMPSCNEAIENIEPERELKKRSQVGSMGDEWIDLRDHDDELAVQPLRRSFSLDSAADKRLYLTVQAAVCKNLDRSNLSEGSCSSRVRRSLFSFSSGRGSRNSVRSLNLKI